MKVKMKTKNESNVHPMILNHPLCKDNPGRSKNLEITCLTNAIYYFIQYVYITHDRETGDYQLVVLHHGRLILYKKYTSQKGAKIAFIKYFGYRAWAEGVKPIWTPLYTI